MKSKQKIINGDCIETMKQLKSCSISSIITDPPYHLTSIVERFGKEGSKPASSGTEGSKGVFGRSSKGFMGKEWDGGDIAFNTEVWTEALRVTKPGGFLFAFGGTRTAHRMAVAIEDSGWVCRDYIEWVYGSGFPKAQDISKQMDKLGGNVSLIKEFGEKLKKAREKRGLTKSQCDEKYCNSSTNWSWFEGRKDGIRIPPPELLNKLKSDFSELEELIDKVLPASRKIVAHKKDSGKRNVGILGTEEKEYTITENETDIAKEWSGYKTPALKPAAEEWIIAQKPMLDEGEPNTIDFEAPFFYAAKCSTKERTCNGKVKNNHPTIKSIKLMEYFIDLITPPENYKKDFVILDPFCGSGTTLLAAKKRDVNAIGIELDEDYFKIAQERLEAYNPNEKEKK